MKIEGVLDGCKTFEIRDVVAKFWRIFNKGSSGYIGTGVFRFE